MGAVETVFAADAPVRLYFRPASPDVDIIIQECRRDIVGKGRRLRVPHEYEDDAFGLDDGESIDTQPADHVAFRISDDVA